MRVSEIYPSIQGEGPGVGKPTVFLRFGGCNLRCPGWPCDTQHAIDPKYRKEWFKLTPEDVAIKTLKVAEEWGITRVCLTGGEPFLQNHREMETLVETLVRNLMEVECFSNGALAYPDWATELISFVMDWKLPGSGEMTYVEQRLYNMGRLIIASENGWNTQSVKFTIADRRDYETAKRIWEEYIPHHVQVFYGVVWGQLTNATLVRWAMEDKLPWRLNVQVHNHIWDRRRRGI